MSKLHRQVLVLLVALLTYSCQDKPEGPVSLEQVKYNNNKTSYPDTKMDSLQAINAITRQKVQEVIDLSILYSSGKKDTEIDSAMYTQILGYFHAPDSLTLQPLLQELEGFKVRSAKVNNLQVYEEYHQQDTLNFARFQVDYFDASNKPIARKQREAQYILVSSPQKFKKQFRFYFLTFYNQPLKDSISEGVTK